MEQISFLNYMAVDIAELLFANYSDRPDQNCIDLIEKSIQKNLKKLADNATTFSEHQICCKDDKSKLGICFCKKR